MAIRLKEPTLTEPYEYISRQDEALDTEREDFEEAWERYLDGGEEPPLRQGQEPTIFLLKPITDATLRAKLVDATQNDGHTTACVAYAAHALESVRGLLDHEGKPYKLRHVSAGGYRHVHPDQITEIGLPIAIELGVRAMNHDSPN